MFLARMTAAALLLVSSTALWADAASHAAEAERLLKLTQADKMAVPVYAQVQQAFAQRHAEDAGPGASAAVLERYQAQANAALDKVIGWSTLKPELIKLYTEAFTEQELKELLAFYSTALGRKMLSQLPRLNQASAQLTQAQLLKAAPQVNGLLNEMSAELVAAKNK